MAASAVAMMGHICVVQYWEVLHVDGTLEASNPLVMEAQGVWVWSLPAGCWGSQSACAAEREPAVEVRQAGS